MFHEPHFLNLCTLWTQKVISQEPKSCEQQLALVLVLLSFGASTVSFKGIIVNCSDRFPALFDLLLYDLLGCCSPCASQVLLTGRELPRACTRHSPGEREMLSGYKEAFSAQQLETTDCLLGETL